MTKKNGAISPVVNPETGERWEGFGRPPNWVKDGKAVPASMMPTIKQVKEFLDAQSDNLLGFSPDIITVESLWVEFICPNNPKHKYMDKVRVYSKELYCVHCGCLMGVRVMKETPCTDPL